MGFGKQKEKLNLSKIGKGHAALLSSPLPELIGISRPCGSAVSPYELPFKEFVFFNNHTILNEKDFLKHLEDIRFVVNYNDEVDNKIRYKRYLAKKDEEELVLTQRAAFKKEEKSDEAKHLRNKKKFKKIKTQKFRNILPVHLHL